LAERPRVLLTRRLPDDLEASLAELVTITRRDTDEPPDEEELLGLLPGHDAVICMLTEPMTEAVLEAGAKTGLQLISQVAVGLDNIALDAARAHGVIVTHTPGVLTDATADLTMALLLTAARRLPEANRFVREARWSSWSLDLMTGLELRGAQLGIVGLGRIGQAVARRARAFGMTIAYSGPRRRSLDVEHELGARHLDLGELLRSSDVTSLHAPLTPETRGLLSADRLRQMKRGAILVNTARGGLVDEAALSHALDEGPLAFAALDVFADEPLVHPDLIDRQDVFLVPHIGSATRRTRHRMAEMATQAVIDWTQGVSPTHRAL